MAEWDAKDNTKPKKENTAHFMCQDCGIETNCVSCDNMEEHGRPGEYVCNHCYDIISGNNECNGTLTGCGGCRYG